MRRFFTPSLEGLTSPTTLVCATGYLCNLFGLGCGVPIELAASNHFNYRHLVKVDKYWRIMTQSMSRTW